MAGCVTSLRADPNHLDTLTMTKAMRVLYTRSDGKWAWRLKVGGDVIAVDGSQGYENEKDCREMADRIVGGYYADADKRIIRPED